MAGPVKNNGISVDVKVGDLLGLKVQLGGETTFPDNHNTQIFGNVTENLGKNPNHAPQTQHAGDGNGTQPNNKNVANNNNGGDPPAFRNGNHNNDGAPPALKNGNHGGDGAPPAFKPGNRNDDGEPARGTPTNKNNQNNNQETGGNQPKGKVNNQGNHGNNGNNGTNRASENGLENGRGHHKTGNQGQGNQTNKTDDFPGNNRGNRNQTQGNHNQGDHHKDTPIFNQRNDNGQNNQRNNNGQNTRNNQPNLGVDLSVDINLKEHGNQPNGLIRSVVAQVLRQNDIYLNNNSVNKIIDNQTFKNSPTNNQTQTNLPREINTLVQNIGNTVLSLLDNSQQNGRLIHQISKEISHQLQENIQTAKTVILKNTDLSATLFRNLNIGERMQAAVELMPRHLPASTVESILNYKSNEILNGMLLARGVIVTGEQTVDARSLMAFQSTALPRDVSMTALRDVGQLVKILISDAASSKSTANLDLGVQKFVRILLANNELGVLLATASLASQTQDRGGLMSRTLALVQIYELINQLLIAGEKAMKQAMPENVAKNVLQNEQKDLSSVKLSVKDENEELRTQNLKSHTTGAESSLRQFLEFNPAFVNDHSASAFNNPDDARSAQKDFVNLYNNDIEQWLKSGNHRFVKDYNFDKPVGVVVERSTDGFFTANTARFVLVRDGSVQGWHFLKTFLVK